MYPTFLFTSKDRLCSESGAYVQNYAGCFQCKDTNRAHDALKSKCKSVITEEDEEEKEITTFEREILTFYVINAQPEKKPVFKSFFQILAQSADIL